MGRLRSAATEAGPLRDPSLSQKRVQARLIPCAELIAAKALASAVELEDRERAPDGEKVRGVISTSGLDARTSFDQISGGPPCCGGRLSSTSSISDPLHGLR
jgi:hypothetical protein